MFAGWLKLACALLCAFLLSLLGTAGEAAHIDAGTEGGAAKWCGAAKPGAPWLSGARGGQGCPLAAAAKTVPARPLPMLAWALRSEPGTCRRPPAAPVSTGLQAVPAENRSMSGVVRLLI